MNPIDFKNFFDNKELTKIEGAFDIHVTVSNDQIYEFNQFCALNNIETVYAIGKTGCHPYQLMTSKYLLKSNGKKALDFAIELANQLTENKIKVIRIKIEALAQNKGIEEFKKTTEYRDHLKYYYEFHFKVDILSPLDQMKFEKICDATNTAFAINLLTKNNRSAPLIAYRVRGDYNKALKSREALIEKFKVMGLKPLMDGTHYEFVIFDSNYDLDKGLIRDPVNV